MGTPRTGPRGSGRRWALGTGAVAVAFLAAVVATRGGSAATGDDLAGPEAAPSPAVTADEAAPSVRPEDRVGLDGVGGLRLGRPVATDAEPGAEAGTLGLSDDGRCTLLRPTAPPAGLDVVAWEVDGVVAAVVMTAPGAATPARTAFGVQFGDDLAVAALLPGAVRSSEDVPGTATGPLGWVVVETDGVEVLASDLGGDAGVTHLELRTPAGRACRTATPWHGASPGSTDPVETGDPAGTEAPAGPVLDAAGRGPVRYQQPVGELRALGLEDSDSFMAYTGCDLWYPGREAAPGTEGLGSVWVRDGRVAGIEVVRGAVAEGVAVGDDVAALLVAFPDLGVDAVDPLALPPFPRTMPDGRTIDVVLLDTYLVPSEVDALLPTDRPVVASVTLWTESCDS